MPDKPAKGEPSELEIIFEKARAGDRQAKQDFITLYVPCLLKVIRSRRTRKTQSIWDSDDFLQQVRVKVDQFHFEDRHFASLPAFIAYVKQIAFREVGQVERKQTRRGDLQPLAAG